MTVKELTTQLLTLTPTEKAEAIQILTKTLTSDSPGIQKTPGVCGGDACIGKTRIPVWGLVSLRYQGASDARILEGYPQLTAADLVNAWVYAEAYPEEIEAALREEDAA